MNQLGTFMKFCMVGVMNTVVYYILYRISLLWLPYLVAHVLSWALATVFSYFVNAWFTFRVRPSLISFAAFPLSSITNLVMSTVISVIFVESLSIDEKYATVIAGIIATPFVFIVARLAFALGSGRNG